MADRLFTEYIRESRPLVHLLIERARLAREGATQLGRRAFAEASDGAIVDNLLEQWAQQAEPIARIGDPRPLDEPTQAERRDPDGPGRLPVWRWYLAFNLSGDMELVARWPAGLEEPPCSSDYDFLPLPSVNWSQSSSGVIACFDVLRSDDSDGRIPPQDRMLDATRYLEAVLAAVNEEVSEYDRVLREELLEVVGNRRAHLGEIADRNVELIELVRAQFGAIELQEVIDLKEAPTMVAAGGQDVGLNFALSTSTFRDLLAATHKWGLGVARYPNEFNSLHEETITSLLVTTLNVVFDTAHREVFHANGKTDIYVQADIGKPTEGAYLGEAKIWSGQGAVCGHVAQLLGYANARNEEVMLLYYVRPLNLELIVSRARHALQQCDEFEKWVDAIGNDTAVVRHPRFGGALQLHLVFVHVPTNGVEDPDQSG